MNKTFVKILFLLAFAAFFANPETNFPILANSKTPAKAGIRSGSKQISKTDKSRKMKKNPSVGAVPVMFEENRGQARDDIKFLSRGENYELFLTASEAVYRLAVCASDKKRLFREQKKQKEACQTARLSMKMLGANPEAAVTGEDKTITESGYFIGRDPDRWLRGIGNYGAVRYQGVYRGVDALFRSAGPNIEYDFIVAPAADPRQIALSFPGAEKIKIDRAGNLVLKLEGFKLVHQKPLAYQMIDGRKRAVAVRYALLGENTIGFTVGEYDAGRELVIDPVVYATYLGGTAGGDSVNDIAVDRNGYIYTVSDERTSPDPSSTFSNILVMKFNPGGSLPVYRYSYGGAEDDVPHGIDVDADGRMYLTGITYSRDFPLNFAEQSSHSINEIRRDYMAFVMRLNENGFIHYSTYLGGECAATFTQNRAQSIAADGAGNAYVTGYTCSASFPVRNAFQSSRQSDFNSFLTKYDSFGRLVYSTYFGGSGDSFAEDVAVDAQGRAYITGNSRSGLYTTAGAYKTSGLGFAAKFDTTKSGGQSLVYSTYIDTPGNGLAVDQSGSAWISTGTGYCGISCGVPPKLFKLNAAGTNLALSPIPLTNYNDEVWDIALDRSDNLFYIESESSGLKAVGRRPDGQLIEKSGFDAGTGRTRVWGVAVGPETGMLYVAGRTTSMNFPTTLDAYQRTSNSPNNFLSQGFIAKITLDVPEERNPLIFIPGTMGSSIRGPWNGFDAPYWVNINPISTTDLPSVYNLTLDVTSPYYTEGLYASDVMQTGSSGIYKPLINALKERNFKAYDISLHHLSIQGCDLSQKNDDPSLNPSLFVFPYDWRKDNILTAHKLKDYIECVQQFYPADTKIDILAHSQGGLVARRYILQQQLQNQVHGIDKVITVASPFLGAPEATYKLYTGGNWEGMFSVFAASPFAIKFLAPYFPSMHQLLPSRKYQGLEGYIVAEGGDVNDNGIPDEVYTFQQNVSQLDADFPATTPGTVGAGFHDLTGQDDWNADQSGVKYYHIVTEQNQLNTTHGLAVKKSLRCRLIGSGVGLSGRCYKDRLYVPEKGFGDKTVPTISAARFAWTSDGRIDLNQPSAGVYIWYSSSPEDEEEKMAEHNGIHTNPETHKLIAYLLGVGPKPVFRQSPLDAGLSTGKIENEPQEDAVDSINEQLFAEFGNGKYPQPPNLSDYSPARYLTITGKTEVLVRDEQGNVASIRDGLLENQAAGLSVYELIGDNSIFLTLAVGHSYTIEFSAGETPLEIDLVEGRGNKNPTAATRFKDLNIPMNSDVRLIIQQNETARLTYDEDNDGDFETLVSPTVNVSGASAGDTTLPTVYIEVVPQNGEAKLSITAQDSQSEISRIWYSLDGENFQIFSSPVTLQYSSNPIRIEAFADDTVGNRSGLYSKTYTFPSVVNPDVSITAPENGSVFPVGTAVAFTGSFSDERCAGHTAVWNFDSTSYAGTVNESAREVSASYTFASPGVYLIKLRVENGCGGAGTADTIDDLTAMIVIYDPDGGFVTGGGWINSPAGAYTPNPELTGRASFGFNSKYQRGANRPTGNTEFQFRVADFNFKSSSYDWLVVAGAKAQFKGSGTINGNGDYAFLLTAIDGRINGGGGQDKFRIKIWDKNSGSIIYDNQIGTSDDSFATTVIGGGSIIVHRQ